MKINRFNIEEKKSDNKYIITSVNIYQKKNNYITFLSKNKKTEREMNIRFEKSKPLEIALMGEEKYIKRIKRGRFRFNKNNLAGIINDLKGKEITEGNKEREKCVKTGKMDFYYSITLKNGKDNNYSLRFRFDKPFKSVIEYEELSINKNHKRSKKEKHENLELKVSNI